MSNYALSILLFFLFIGTAISQEYLLDSFSTCSTFYTSQGPNKTSNQSKFKYDSDRKIVSEVKKLWYRMYSYSDEKNTINEYWKETDELHTREIELLNSDGYVVRKSGEFFHEGNVTITVLDSMIRDENNVLTHLIEYKERIDSKPAIRLTQYFRNSDESIDYEVVKYYRDVILESDLLYTDTTSYTYEDGILIQKNYVRYNESGTLLQCEKTTFSYFDDHYTELVEKAESGSCTGYTRYTESFYYYSDSEFYDFDLVQKFGDQDVGWEIYYERSTEGRMEGEDVIVEYEGFFLAPQETEQEGIYVYKKADQLINTKPIEREFQPAIVPNLTSKNSIVTIEMGNFRKIDVQLFSLNGQLLESHSFERGQNMQFTAPGQDGIYYAKIIDRSNKRFEIKKLVVY